MSFDRPIGPRVSAFADDALGDHDAVALAAAVRGGDVTSAELIEAAIERAERVNPQLNAVAVWDVDRARLAATTHTDTTPASTAAAPFSGVPTFVKSMASVEGLPNRFGSRAMPDTPATENSITVEQLQSTGLISLGLSTMPEFGLTATTESALAGATRNPWSLEHSSGGSSGGSSALVAAGVVPIAHANDGGGSIRIPAACCGLVGLKPSRGRVAQEPLPKLFPLDIAAEGVVSRSVRDTAAFMAAAERFRPATGMPAVGHVNEPGSRRLRIGVVTERNDGTEYDRVNTTELLRVAAWLDELGHEVEMTKNTFPVSIEDDFLMVWAFFPFLMWQGGKRLFGPGWDRDELEPFTKWLVAHFRRNIAKAPMAFRRVRKFARDYPQAYGRHDVLLTPTLGGPIHRLGCLAGENDGDVVMARSRQQVPTTWIHNGGGGPAISLPLATDTDGVPLGIQFAADIGNEAMLLALALELEAAHPWPQLG
ncbi:MAG: amidase [Actinomycetota bacterium]